MPHLPERRVISKNEYDITSGVGAIMEAENWLLERLPTSVPIVILMGETHDILSHTAVQQKTLEHHLANAQIDPSLRFSVGLEQPHDHLKNMPHVQTWPEWVNAILRNQTPDDPNGARVLNGLLKKPFDPSFNQTSLIKYCLEHRISTKLNDLSREYIHGIVEGKERVFMLLNEWDKQTKRLYRANGGSRDVLKRVVTSEIAVTARNMGIVENALAHLNATQARIYIQQCGLAHVLGSKPINRDGKEHKYTYQKSLHALFREAGCAVIAVVPAKEDKKPSDADTSNVIFIEGLSEQEETPDLQTNQAHYACLTQ